MDTPVMEASKNSRDADTLPATPLSNNASQPAAASVNTSGIRPAATAQAAGDEAHAEMLRAVERGACVLLCSHEFDDGAALVWSAWLTGAELVAQSWLRPKQGHWSKGPSFVVLPDEIARLASLITRPEH